MAGIDDLLAQLAAARGSLPLPTIPGVGGNDMAAKLQAAGQGFSRATAGFENGMGGGGGSSAPQRPMPVMMAPQQRAQQVYSDSSGVMPTASGGHPVGSMPMPASLTPYVAGGPAARMGGFGEEPPNNFDNPQARNASIASSAMKDLTSMVMGYKQKKFETESSEASVITQAQLAKAKQSHGEPLNPQDMQAIESAAKLEKKHPKLMEKAMTDPTSAAYVGVQRAYQQEQMRQQQQAELEAQKQKMLTQQAEQHAHEAQAGLYGAQADYWQNEKGANERARIDEKDRETVSKRMNAITRAFSAVAAKQGMQPVLDEAGQLRMDENGQPMMRPLNKDDAALNPSLAAEIRLKNAKADELYKRGIAEVGRVDVARMEHARKQKESDALSAPGALTAAINLLRDPNSGPQAVSKLPAKLYAAAISQMQKQGEMPVRQYSNEELKTIRLAGNAKENIDQLIEIAQRRPDLFGMGGWGVSKMKAGIGSADPDARALMAAAKTAALPTIGIHGSRAQKLAQDISDPLSDMYQSQEAYLSAIGVINDSVNELYTNAGRQPQATTPTPKRELGGQTTGGDKKASDPLGLND